MLTLPSTKRGILLNSLVLNGVMDSILDETVDGTALLCVLFVCMWSC